MSRLIKHGGLLSAIAISSSAASIGLIGGILLQSVEARLLTITPLLIALPALNTIAGDYATLITAHFGDPEAQAATRRKLIITLTAAVPLSAFGIIFLSLFLSTLENYTLDAEQTLRYSGFILASLMSVVVAVYATSSALQKILQKRQINSDDILIPASNSLASIIMLGLLAVAAWAIF